MEDDSNGTSGTSTRNSQPATRNCCHEVPSAGIHALLPAYRATVRELVERTQPLFVRGRGLWPLVERDVRTDIQLFTLGGESILRLIERQGYDTLARRPALGKGAKAALLLRAVAGKLGALVAPGRSGGPA